MYLQILKIFIDIVTPVFFLILLGYYVGPRLELDAKTLSRTAYFLLVPCFVFDIISRVDIDIAVAGQMILYTSLTHILVALTAFIIARLLNRSREITAAFVIIATFGNVGNLGLSIIDFRLGQAAQTSATIYFITIVLVSFVICVGISSWTRGTGLSAVLSVFKTPALIAMVPALFFYGTNLEPPLFLSRITGLLGRAMIPVMLVTLGVQLSGLGKFNFSRDVVIASCLRLIAAPLIAFGLSFVFSLSGMEIRSGILQAGMPVAVLGSIIAIEYNIIPKFVTTAVLFSTLFSLLTLTILLYLI
ncbi:MAG: AEC family transporter [Desulfobacula sp.]|jgi:malate permease and related proteins|uniref:AEC family transporter n=1 Tax=Desulfobacula sp. TaxID=2593537 RepID=UPI001D67F866|nr:AEC family transporter [Desulfobacula sp.]MBT3803456.1 AEC family transporter [Desulfobacula sp.]MBT4023251.1 AEC family transporter [Desulfobacula sp.]MBT4197237.1 AEC family transporter [Desulfobacula sp.]MBT4504917.1 AEC family transporter [Desulfobacula sp.]